MSFSLTILPPELHGVILTYLCPLKDHQVLQVLNTKFKNSLNEWTKSLEITTRELLYQTFWCNMTRVNNCLHRTDDKPAIEYEDGDKEWYFNNKRHRAESGDKPAVEYVDGYKAWYLHDKLHRSNDKPAIEGNGQKEWWINGKRHRSCGQPAIVRANGNQEWWIDSKRIDPLCVEEEAFPWMY